jgi:hypothetical protein
MCSFRHCGCLQPFSTAPTEPPTCCPHLYQRASESAAGTVGFRYNYPCGSVPRHKLQWLAEPSHTQVLTLCGPYSSIYAGVVPRTSSPGLRRAAHRRPCPRWRLWPTEPAIRTASTPYITYELLQGDDDLGLNRGLWPWKWAIVTLSSILKVMISCMLAFPT